jgi:hypothetical protein
MLFFTKSDGGTLTERMRITSGGHVGIKITPNSGWGSAMTALQLGTGGVLSNWTGANNNMSVGVNYYDNGSGSQIRLYTGGVSVIDLSGDVITFRNAGSDSAGTTISFVERMRITSGGDTELVKTGIAGITNSTSNTLRFRNTQTNAQSVILGTIFTTSPGSWGGDMIFTTHPSNGSPDDSTTERMRITSGGNIGINKSNPDVNSILDVNGQTFVAHLAIYNNNGTPSLGTSPILYSPASGTLAISTNTAERMRINSSGNVGIGADPAYRLHVNFDGCGQYVSQITNQNSSDCGGSSVLILQGGTFNSSDTTSKYISFRRGDGNEIGSVRRNGTSNVVYETSSDYRLKTDLKDFSGLDKLSKIKVYDFKWVGDDQRMEGVIAHELQEVIPYAVGGIKDDIDEDGNILAQGVDYSKIVPVLVKAIQELKAEIEILKQS